MLIYRCFPVDGSAAIGKAGGGLTRQTDFCVDYVKVYQNENYLPAVQPDSAFTGSFDLD